MELPDSDPHLRANDDGDSEQNSGHIRGPNPISEKSGAITSQKL